MSWSDTHHGPVSIPPRGVVYGAATAVALAAVIGLGIGFRAGWRDGGRTPFGASDQSQGVDSAVIAKPVVDIPQVEQQAPPAVAANAIDNSDDNDSNAIAAKAAAAQALQSKPVTTTPTIDDVEASPSEKPEAAAKPSTDEGEPGAPVKTDVPF